MAEANSKNSTIDSSRRKFMAFTAAASAVAAGSLAVAAVPPARQACSLNDISLIEMERQYFEAYAAANANRAEIEELNFIFRAEHIRLRAEVDAGRMQLTPQECWDAAGSIPAAQELDRLEALAEPHYNRANDLVEQMDKIPATTPEGRRAKLLVILNVLDPDWREEDEATDWCIRLARNLMIEFVGGEPGEQLRNQFA